MKILLTLSALALVGVVALIVSNGPKDPNPQGFGDGYDETDYEESNPNRK